MIVFNIAAFELRRLFASPLAWIVLAVIQFLAAMFFYVLLSRYLEAPQDQAGGGITSVVVAGTLQITGIIMLMVSPFLTMRLFSDEQRNGTLQLLYSSPVSLTQLVLGKYFGIVLFLLLAVFMISLMPLSLLPGTNLDLGLLAAGLLGLVLVVFTFAAAGLFISTLTAQPGSAAVATFGVLFLLWIVHLAGNTTAGPATRILSYLSLLKHFNQLLQGLVSSVDVGFFLILSAAFILLSIWRLDAVRTHHW